MMIGWLGKSSEGLNKTKKIKKNKRKSSRNGRQSKY